MAKWIVRPANERMIGEIQRLFVQPDVKLTCQNLLRLLGDEEHPGFPADQTLDVARLANQAPDWYRLKIVRHNVRIIFSLAHLEGNRFVEYQFREHRIQGAENYLLIRLANYRNDDTYAEVRRRWLQSRG